MRRLSTLLLVAVLATTRRSPRNGRWWRRRRTRGAGARDGGRLRADAARARHHGDAPRTERQPHRTQCRQQRRGDGEPLHGHPRPARVQRRHSRLGAHLAQTSSRGGAYLARYGRVPRHVPRVTWRDVRRVSMTVAGGCDWPRTGGPRRQPSLRHHGGSPHVGDRSGAAGDHVPRGRPAGRPAAAVARRVPAARPYWGRPASHRAADRGRAGATRSNPSSVQADNGAGLTRGVIGLVNKGKRRRPETDWGALRAWAWGVEPVLDHRAPIRRSTPQRVAIEGVALRQGSADGVRHALLSRRLARAARSSCARRSHREPHLQRGVPLVCRQLSQVRRCGGRGGRKEVSHPPVDSHLLIALCAPRCVFVSHGIPERGRCPLDSISAAAG